MDDVSVAQSLEETHENRECFACLGCGQVLEDVEVAYGWFETKAEICAWCDGSGIRRSYIYPHARRSR